MQVIATPKALKQYNHLPKTEQVKIKKKLLVLEQNSKEGKKLSGEYTELRSLRVWPYRIIYYIDKVQKKIFIVTIAHRQGVYK
jgi:mRNA-degrading endonuclease RelE of RelBE toxin-antitoxin system